MRSYCIDVSCGGASGSILLALEGMMVAMPAQKGQHLRHFVDVHMLFSSLTACKHNCVPIFVPRFSDWIGSMPLC